MSAFFHSLQNGYTLLGVGMSNETLPEYMYMGERVRKRELNVRITLRVKLKSPFDAIRLCGLLLVGSFGITFLMQV